MRSISKSFWRLCAVFCLFDLNMGSTATAQEVNFRELIKTCSSMSSAVQRLDCYDKLPALASENQSKTHPSGGDTPSTANNLAQPPSIAPTPPSDNQTVAPEGKWLVLEDKDEMTDKSNVILMLESEESASPRRNETLIIRCRNNKTDVFVNFDKYLGYSSPKITYRIGSNPPKIQNWSESTTKKSAFSPNPIALIKELLTGNSLLVEAYPYQEGRLLVKFDTTNLSNSIHKVQTLCNWK